MLKIKTFSFNPFAVNTYVLWDESGDGIIIDAGNYTNEENRILLDFLDENQIKITGIYLTHNHIDHIMGIKFLADSLKLPVNTHSGGDFLFEVAAVSAASYGMDFAGIPEEIIHIEERDDFKFGVTEFRTFYTPGHVDGSLCYFFPDYKKIVVGDVLFSGSIGRTDLPTGDFDILEKSIRNKLYTLDD